MPIYEYLCERCGKKKEIVIINNGGVDMVVCSDCNEVMIKIISAPRMKTETRGMFAKGEKGGNK